MAIQYILCRYIYIYIYNVRTYVHVCMQSLRQPVVALEGDVEKLKAGDYHNADRLDQRYTIVPTLA